MPLTPYLRPQSTITQILRATPPAEFDRTNPVVIGTQYKLVLNDGRPMVEYPFESAGRAEASELPYEELIGGAATPVDDLLYTPIAAGAKLYGRDLLAKVSTAGLSLVLKTGGVAPAELRLEGVSTNLADYRTGGAATLVANVQGRSVRVGDYVSATVAGAASAVWRRVTALFPRMSAASVAAVDDSASLLVDDSPDSDFVRSSDVTSYSGAVNTRVFFKVLDTVGSVVTLKVWDSAGLMPVQDGLAVTVGAAGATVIGLGIEIKLAALFTAGDGDIFYMDAVAPAALPNQYNGVLLDGPIGGSAEDPVAALVFQSFTGEITNDNLAGVGTAYAANSDGMTYAATLGLRAPATGASAFAPFEDGKGSVVVSYKAAKKVSATEGPIVISRSEEITALLGETDPENVLARGVFEAFSGNQSRTTYALRVEDDTVEAYTAALNKIRTTDIYYALAPMTDSLDVMQLVVAHCEEMSNKYNKNFRRCYVGTDSPGEYTVWGELTAGGFRQASLAGRVVTLSEDYRSGNDFTQVADVGDLVKFGSLDRSYAIVSVTSAYEVILEVAADGITLPAEGIQLIRAANPANTVRFLSERATALNSRRCVNVWSDNALFAGASGNTFLPSKFIAAEVAGIRCALLPQQGLTMTEINSVVAAPTMYTTFTPEQLDEIASYGNLIVTQESLNGEMFIRHQLTTDVNNGALAYQDNVGVIVDVFSYMEKDAFRNYIGKRNVTQATITALRVELMNLGIAATQVPAQFAEYGPMILRFFDENGKEGAVTVRTDGQLADRLYTYIKLRVALPLDGLDNYIDVESSVEL